VVEVTTNTWWFYDQTYPSVGQLLVADPRKIAWIAQTKVKTDAHDVMKLARLSAAGLIPLVWVPPLLCVRCAPCWPIGGDSSERRPCCRTEGSRNRLHSLLHRLQIAPPEGDPFCAKHRAWWVALQVSPTERLHVRHDLATLDQVVGQLGEIDDELRRLSCAAPWSDVIPYLLHLPGVGLIVAMTVLAAIGDITRFPTSKNWSATVGWWRACMTVGRRIAPAISPRKAARNCATSWSKPPGMPSRRMTFGKPSSSGCADRLRRGAQQGHRCHCLSTARRHLACADRTRRRPTRGPRHGRLQADTCTALARSASAGVTWSWKLTNEQRGGLTTRQFVRYQLLRLGLGHDLTHVVRGGGKYLIAPPDEVLKLKPELHATT